jgi:hypothetical protein
MLMFAPITWHCIHCSHRLFAMFQFLCTRLQLSIFRRVGKVSKSDYQLRHFCPCVRPYVLPHGTTRIPLDGFSFNFIFGYFSKHFREHSSLIKIEQEWQILDIKTTIYLLLYLAQFLLQWDVFHTKLVYKIKTHFFCSVTFIWKSCLLWDNVGKY